MSIDHMHYHIGLYNNRAAHNSVSDADPPIFIIRPYMF